MEIGKELVSRLEAEFNGRVFLTPSCTSALEVAFLSFLSPGDEVIMPDFLFPSLANAVILRGGVPVFIDIRLDDLNLDEERIGSVLGPRTKAIAPIHYSGVLCDMDRISGIADSYGLFVVEDAAQAIGVWRCSGDLGCVSFHETKNLGVGEGGCLVVRNRSLEEEVELLVDCGTTKARWKRGESSGYEWQGVGTSALMSPRLYPEILEKYLGLSSITDSRRRIFRLYREGLESLPCARLEGNGHIFWFLTPNREEVKRKLLQKGVPVASHYEAASQTRVGRKYGRFGEVVNSKLVADQILRLPTGVSEERAVEIINIVKEVTNGVTE